MLIAAIYARKSTEAARCGRRTEVGYSAVEHARAYAARKGWTVDDSHIYVDDWNQSRKCDVWGHKRQSARPEADWIRLPLPARRIVTDTEWNAAHTRLKAARAVYLRGTRGQTFGRPALGSPSKYPLTGLAQCGECGNGLIVKSRSHGQQRRYFYAGGGYHNRGTAVCSKSPDMRRGVVPRRSRPR